MITYQNSIPTGLDEIRKEFESKEWGSAYSTERVALFRSIIQCWNLEGNSTEYRPTPIVNANEGVAPKYFYKSKKANAWEEQPNNGKKATLLKCFKKEFLNVNAPNPCIAKDRQQLIDFLLYCRAWKINDCQTAQERLNTVNRFLLQLGHVTLYPLSVQDFCVMVTIVYELNYAQYLDLEKAVTEFLDKHPDSNNWETAEHQQTTPVFAGAFRRRFTENPIAENSTNERYPDVKKLAMEFVDDFASDFGRTRVRAYYVLKQLVVGASFSNIANTLNRLSQHENVRLKSMHVEQELKKSLAYTFVIKKHLCKRFLVEAAQKDLQKIGTENLIGSIEFSDYVEDLLKKILPHESFSAHEYYEAEGAVRNAAYSKLVPDLKKLDRYFNAASIIAKDIEAGVLPQVLTEEIEKLFKGLTPEFRRDYRLALEYIERKKSVTKEELVLMSIFFTTSEQILNSTPDQTIGVFNEILQILDLPSLSASEKFDFLFLTAIYNTTEEMCKKSAFPYRDYIFKTVLEYISEELIEEVSEAMESV